MNIKRFVAQDMRQAIRLVREKLGPEAVILSNKTVEGGVELTAAVDLHESELATEIHDSRIEVREASVAKPMAPESAPAQAAPAPEDPLVMLRREVSEIRSMMRHELGELTWLDLGARRPERRELMRRLMTMGLDSDVARRATDKLPKTDDLEVMWRKTLYNIAALLPGYDAELLEHGGVVVLVGPTGVGKTTTLAKIAARFALKHGHRHVGLVSIDNYRIGAQDQLHTYGRILDVPVRQAASSEQLDDVIEDMSRRKLILIDSAGTGAGSEQFAAQAELLSNTQHDLSRLLVLSAPTERSTLERTVELFADLKPDATILSKLDESASLGGALSALIGSELPLAFVTDGQRVPEDLHVARAHKLVSRAAELASALTEDSTYLAFANGEQLAGAQA